MTTEEIETLEAVCSLLWDEKIPFKKIKPLVEAYSRAINDTIKRRKERRYQAEIAEIEQYIKTTNKHIDDINNRIKEGNDAIAGFKTELEGLESKRSPGDDERIRNLLWWIYNNKKDVELLEVHLRTEEVRLKKLEEDLKKAKEKIL